MIVVLWLAAMLVHAKHDGGLSMLLLVLLMMPHLILLLLLLLILLLVMVPSLLTLRLGDYHQWLNIHDP